MWWRRYALWVGPVVVAALVAIAVVVMARGQVEKPRWWLVDISADARILTIGHEHPHCGNQRKLSPEVDESDDSIAITVRYSVNTAAGGCNSDYQARESTIRLDRPLGRRTIDRAVSPSQAEPNYWCTRIARYPPGAQVRQALFVQRLSRRCNAPLPASLKRVPLLNRGSSDIDRLPSDGTVRFRPGPSFVDRQGFVLREGLARGTRRPARMVLTPGPGHSCLSLDLGPPREDRVCDESAAVGRRGIAYATRCATNRITRVVGVAAGGVDRVILKNADGVVARAVVRDGVYALRGRSGSVLIAGTERVPLNIRTQCGPLGVVP